jgi:hypothetical protein
MKKKHLPIIIVTLLAVSGVFIFSQNKNTPSTSIASDYKDATYILDGKNVILKNTRDKSSDQVDSSGELVYYFGNDLITDLNSDGYSDTVFLVTKQTSRGEILYYVVGAIYTTRGYIGTDGYYLGDRIAPQTINVSKQGNHKNVIVVNYAKRKEREQITVQPSLGASVYLKLDEHNRWGIVMQDFEGEHK